MREVPEISKRSLATLFSDLANELALPDCRKTVQSCNSRKLSFSDRALSVKAVRLNIIGVDAPQGYQIPVRNISKHSLATRTVLAVLPTQIPTAKRNETMFVKSVIPLRASTSQLALGLVVQSLGLRTEHVPL